MLNFKKLEEKVKEVLEKKVVNPENWDWAAAANEVYDKLEEVGSYELGRHYTKSRNPEVFYAHNFGCEFLVADNETNTCDFGNFETKEEAEKFIQEQEEKDKKNNDYEENYYQIILKN